jgi:hypothetical protein
MNKEWQCYQSEKQSFMSYLTCKFDISINNLVALIAGKMVGFFPVIFRILVPTALGL